jgi:hypothetical protein
MNNRLEVYKPQMDVVEMIFEMFVIQGLSIRKIFIRLNELKIEMKSISNMRKA